MWDGTLFSGHLRSDSAVLPEHTAPEALTVRTSCLKNLTGLLGCICIYIHIYIYPHKHTPMFYLLRVMASSYKYKCFLLDSIKRKMKFLQNVVTKCTTSHTGQSLEISQQFNNYWMKTTHSYRPLTDLFSHSEKSSSSQPRSSMPSHSLSHPSSLQSTTGTISNGTGQ